jgi:hypothetical protein
MSVTELKRLMTTAGIQLEGLETRDALVDRLCMHFGIKRSELKEIVESKATAGGSVPAPKPKRRPSLTSLTPAEAAMNARMHFTDKQQGFDSFAKQRPMMPPTLPSLSTAQHQVPAPPERMDNDSLQKVLSLDPFRKAPAPPQPTANSSRAPSVTTERLHEMERKLRGGFAGRRTAPRKRDEPAGSVQPLDLLQQEQQQEQRQEQQQQQHRKDQKQNVLREEQDKDDDSIDSDIDYIEQLRMKRWRVSDLEIPPASIDSEPEFEAPNVQLASRAMLDNSEDEEEDEEGEEEDDDEDEDGEKKSATSAGKPKSPLAAFIDASRSPTKSSPVPSPKTSGQIPRLSLSTLQQQQEQILAARLADLAATQQLFEAQAGVGLETLEKPLTGRMRAPRPNSAETANANSSSSEVKQRSPQQAAELQEEVDFWVHSPRGASYDEMMTSRPLSRSGNVPASSGASGASNFLFYG